MIEWKSTYDFLGYKPSNVLEKEIEDKSKEIGTPYKISPSINPNIPPFILKFYFYPLTFLQQYFQDRVGNPQ